MPRQAQAKEALQNPIPLTALELTPVGVRIEPLEGGELTFFREKECDRREHGAVIMHGRRCRSQPGVLRLLCFTGG
jgi:hypothetical protein